MTIGSTQLNGFNYHNLTVIVLFNANYLFADIEVVKILLFIKGQK